MASISSFFEHDVSIFVISDAVFYPYAKSFNTLCQSYFSYAILLFFCLIHNARNNMNASHAQQPFHPPLTVNPQAFHSSSLNRRLYERVYNNNDPQMRGLYIGCCFDVYFGLFNLLGDERVWKVFTAEHYDFPYFSISIKNRLKYLSLLCWWCS